MRKVLTAAVLFLLLPGLLFSKDLALNQDKTVSPPLLIIDFLNVDKTLYLQTLEEGYTSEITFKIRLSKKNSSFFFLNQQGRSLKTITKEAMKEYLTDMYIINSDGTERAYPDEESFINAFFSCSLEIPDKYFNSDEYIIEVRAAADLIKRPKPLSLLEPFLPSEITETGWIRFGN